MIKAHKTRLYPTKEQSSMIDKIIGCSRFVYNNSLAYKKEKYEKENISISKYDLIKRIAQLKQQEEMEWLKEADSIALQQAILDLDSAYKKFFKEKKGFPKFHKKGIKDSYRTNNSKLKTKHWLLIPKVGLVKVEERLNTKWNIHSITISKKADKYFVSILVDFEPKIPSKIEEKQVGIDLGIKDFAVFSNGEKVPNPKYLEQYQKRLAILQKRLSRKQKGSKNRNKARIKVANMHLKISNKRSDFLNKLSTAITKQYTLVALEDLNVNGMLKNHKLAQSISSCSWSEFVRQLQYKGEWYICEIKQINRFFPSSKTCSCCGHVLDELSLNTREWICPKCGVIHDRDINASINILKEAISPMDNRVESVELSAVVETLKQKNLTLV